VPKPAVQIGGQQDKLVTPPESKLAMANVRKLNACPDQGQSCGNGCTRYSSTKNAPVIQAFHSGGHLYPAQATNLIVNFFKEITGSNNATSNSAAESISPQANAEEEPGDEVQMPEEPSDATADSAGKAENITFPSGALMLHGWIYKPQGVGQFPALIWNHGSEKNQDRIYRSGDSTPSTATFCFCRFGMATTGRRVRTSRTN
jgi:hypothetical protein